jgi:hypothetical protein
MDPVAPEKFTVLNGFPIHGLWKWTWGLRADPQAGHGPVTDPFAGGAPILIEFVGCPIDRFGWVAGPEDSSEEGTVTCLPRSPIGS